MLLAGNSGCAIYLHFPHYSNHGMQSPGGAIREGNYKLLDYFENGSVQLFNPNDEQNDLSTTTPAKAKALHQNSRPGANGFRHR